jgi:anti-sigma factor RsiW
MTDHLSPATLNALADGELSADQLATTQQHLAACPDCTSSALSQTLLKSAMMRAGRRYVPPQHLLDSLARQIPAAAYAQFQNRPQQQTQSIKSRAIFGWASAAALLLISLSVFFIQRHQQQIAVVLSVNSSLVAEAADQHIATLSANQPLAVLSSDKHTVKPWFQGKLPFTFNLPDNLPTDTRLDGANLTYLQNQPAAQLLYSIGKHRVSVFVQQSSTSDANPDISADPAGFHLIATSVGKLRLTAISDVDRPRLRELVNALTNTQTGNRTE